MARGENPTAEPREAHRGAQVIYFVIFVVGLVVILGWLIKKL